MDERKPRLLKWQYDELNAQYAVTPSPDEGSASTGEHFKLMSVLNQFKFYPSLRYEAMQIAEQLLEAGWRDE